MRSARRFFPVTILFIFFSLLAVTTPAAPQKNSWPNAIDALAAKIATAADARSPSLHLKVKNISSLDAARVIEFRQELEANLQRRGVKLAADGTADATVEVNITENLRAIIFAAEVQRNDSPEVVLVSLDRADADAKSDARPAVRLQREFVWSQPDPILDFQVLPAAPDAPSRLVVLEPRRLVIYRSAEGSWQPQESHPLPSLPSARDPRGTLTPPDTDADASIGVTLPGAKCTLKTRERFELTCSPARDIRSNVETDFVSLAFNCGTRSQALLTGDADWTRPDSLRVVEVTGRANQVGEAMSFSGPILVLWPGTQSETARVIWRDLATGDYEAGIITASCSP
jgi:hypothetical protein